MDHDYRASWSFAGVILVQLWAQGNVSKSIWLSLNLLDTFRALRTIRRSGRGIGILARRKAMRGCLTGWIVFWTIQSVADLPDRIFGWLPFYAPIRFIVVLGILCARVSASNSIYKSVLRPFLKRYETPIDLTALLLSHIGALVIYWPMLVLIESCTSSWTSLKSRSLLFRRLVKNESRQEGSENAGHMGSPGQGVDLDALRETFPVGVEMGEPENPRRSERRSLFRESIRPIITPLDLESEEKLDNIPSEIPTSSTQITSSPKASARNPITIDNIAEYTGEPVKAVLLYPNIDSIIPLHRSIASPTTTAVIGLTQENAMLGEGTGQPTSSSSRIPILPASGTSLSNQSGGTTSKLPNASGTSSAAQAVTAGITSKRPAIRPPRSTSTTTTTTNLSNKLGKPRRVLPVSQSSSTLTKEIIVPVKPLPRSRTALLPKSSATTRLVNKEPNAMYSVVPGDQSVEGSKDKGKDKGKNKEVGNEDEAVNVKVKGVTGEKEEGSTGRDSSKASFEGRHRNMAVRPTVPKSATVKTGTNEIRRVVAPRTAISPKSARAVKSIDPIRAGIKRLPTRTALPESTSPKKQKKIDRE